MSRFSRQLSTGLLAVAGMIVTASAQSGGPPAVSTPQQCIIRLQPNHIAEAVASSYGGSVSRSIPSRRTFLLEFPPAANLEAILTALNGDGRLVWAEHNVVQIAPGGQTQSFFLSSTYQNYVEQYAIPLLQIPASLPPAAGPAPVIAILDTGIDTEHPALAGRAVAGFNFVDNTPNTGDLPNGLDDDNDGLVDEMTGHGTMVAGIASLVAPSAGLVAFKVLDSDGNGSAFALAQAIDAAAASGAAVINMSVGSTVPSQAVLDAVENALSMDVLLVAATGNRDRQDPPFYPAAYPGVLAVAATDALDAKAPFSDFGSYVGIAAPGVGIVGPLPGGLYGQGSGTSLSAPWVSGAAALLRSYAPALSAAQLADTLTLTSTDVTAQNPSLTGLLGAGRAHAGDALGAIPPLITCYANCDGSTAAPALNVADFTCFLQQFASGSVLANCDGSSSIPQLNVADFSCFLQRFAGGCP